MSKLNVIIMVAPLMFCVSCASYSNKWSSAEKLGMIPHSIEEADELARKQILLEKFYNLEIHKHSSNTTPLESNA